MRKILLIVLFILSAGLSYGADQYKINPYTSKLDNAGPAGLTGLNSNIGINSTNPGVQLDVQGTIRVTGFILSTSPSNGYVLTSDANGKGIWQAAGGAGTSYWVTGNVGINTTNNVGIGSVNPGQNLDVNGTIRASAFNKLGGTSLQFLKADGSIDSTSYGTGSGTVNSGTANQAAYYASSTTAVSSTSNLIFNGNNVGVGSSNPGQQLDVNGTVRASVFTKSGGTSSQFLKADGSVDSTTYSTGSLWATQNTTDQSLAGGNVGIGTTLTTTSALSIMNGNIGIGTWKPAALFQVGLNASSFRVDGTGSITVLNGGTVTFNTSQLSMSNSPNVNFANTNNTAGTTATLIGGGSTTSSAIIQSTTANGTTDAIKFRMGNNAATKAMDLVDNSGTVNVGIGTNVPSAMLEIGTRKVDILSGGNVGIGSITPGQLLDVFGTVRLSGSGHIISTGSAPTVANNDCGTTVQGTITAGSTDLKGKVTAGTLNVTSCAATFAGTFNAAPICICQDDTTATLGTPCTTSTTKMTITSTTSMSSDVISYICVE